MKNHLLKTTILLLFCSIIGIGQSFSQNQSIPFTLQDRERLIRMEEQMKSLKEEMNIRFSAQKEEMNSRFSAQKEEMNSRFSAQKEEMKSFKEEINSRFQTLTTLIYFVLGGVFGLIGLIFWDRRSYIKPVKDELKRLKAVLRELSQKQPELAELMRAHGLL